MFAATDFFFYADAAAFLPRPCCYMPRFVYMLFRRYAAYAATPVSDTLFHARYADQFRRLLLFVIATWRHAAAATPLAPRHVLLPMFSRCH